MSFGWASNSPPPDLAASELAKPLQQAKLKTLIEGIGHTVAEQLEPVLRRCPEDEIDASLTAVEVALESIDLSDEALLADDADPGSTTSRSTSRAATSCRSSATWRR
ncbi:hypothetical protein ACIA8G_20060 [Lentzea sp. NPDC051213]|uniref:NACHT N-terminal Helical domain 1-containing protein n=1 Tax=Lentzea sp. NPDC051213 TaxID=3364126 RepID=UPI0037B167B8